MKTVKAQKYGINKDGKEEPIMIIPADGSDPYPFTQEFPQKVWDRLEETGNHPWKKYSEKPAEVKIKTSDSKNQIGGVSKSELENMPESEKEKLPKTQAKAQPKAKAEPKQTPKAEGGEK